MVCIYVQITLATNTCASVKGFSWILGKLNNHPNKEVLKHPLKKGGAVGGKTDEEESSND